VPLTAVHAELGRIRAGADGWTAVYRVRNAPITCPGCGARVYGAVPPRGLAHFRHHRRDADDPCWLTGESMQHLELKARVLDMVEAVPGWSAELEISGDGGAWC
jgi:competence CoiA-like predicted nuclease